MFDARPSIPLPLSDRKPHAHHLGFVVSDLESALFRLQAYDSPYVSADYTLLEREEHWSLYFHYRTATSRSWCNCQRSRKAIAA